MSEQWDELSLSELIRVQQELERTLYRRFAVERALMFTDVVGSAAFFRKHGDSVGHGLQRRHLAALNRVLESNQGKLVDTAGDGGFSWFTTPLAAISAAIELQKLIAKENLGVAHGRELVVRVGIHFGQVLQDDEVVTGDAVNLCARVTQRAGEGEVVLTRDVFFELRNNQRLLCRPLEAAVLKGFAEPVEVYALNWRDQRMFPDRVRIEETGEVYELDPAKELITFGRLSSQGGQQANDIVLRLPDESQTKMISRWHFQLERREAGYLLRPVSPATIEVDGTLIPMSAEAPVFPGVSVRVSRVMTLKFLGPEQGAGDAVVDDQDFDETVVITKEQLAGVPLRDAE